MSVQLMKKREQAAGAFDHGRIRENKPVGFPHEGGVTKPISNLFYWAHAWSDTGGLIDKHPHQGFEIMSYVIDGTISHYDSQMEAWKNLSKGDAQLIKSGNGITHAEKLLPGAHIFQIWFDPNLNESLKKPASYADFSSNLFEISSTDKMTRKVIVGKGSPMTLDSEGIEIVEYCMQIGDHILPSDSEYTFGIYIVSGEIKIDNNTANTDDFILAKELAEINLTATVETTVFVIKAKNEVNYRTYAQTQGMA